MSLCLFPFIPKSSARILNLKSQAAYTLFAHDFENRVCEIKERACKEGALWVEGKKEGDVLFTVNQTVYFEDLRLAGKVVGAVSLKKMYGKKEGGKKLYRLTIEFVYSSPQFKKKFPYNFYLTLSD